MRLSLAPTLLAFTLTISPFCSSQVSAIHPQVLSPRTCIPVSDSFFTSTSRTSQYIRSLHKRQCRSPCQCIRPTWSRFKHSLLFVLEVGIDPFLRKYRLFFLSPPQDLNVFLNTNVDVKALIGILGKDTVSVLISALVSPIYYQFLSICLSFLRKDQYLSRCLTLLDSRACASYL
jgi:hypothetical protein